MYYKAIIASFFLLLSIFLFSSCEDNVTRKLVVSPDGMDTLTILKVGTKGYLIRGNYKSDSIPISGYMMSEGFYEYCTALIRWEESKTTVFSTYCDIDSSRNGKEMEYRELTGIEFEEMKKDSLNYKYVYW